METETLAYLLSLPPFIAATLCGLLVLKNSGLTARIHFFTLAFMSLCQGSGYIAYTANFNEISELCADLFNCGLYFMFTNLVMISAHLDERLTKKISYSLYGAPLLLVVFYATGFMVEGYKIQNQSLMHIDGVLAWVGDYYQMLCVVAFLVILCWNSVQLKDVERYKNLAMLLSLFPLAALFGLVILLSTTEYALSFAIVAPVMTLYMAISYHFITRDSFVRRISLALKVLRPGFNNAETEEVVEGLHRLHMEDALKQSDSARGAAEAMDLPYSTFRARIRKLKMDANDYLKKK